MLPNMDTHDPHKLRISTMYVNSLPILPCGGHKQAYLIFSFYKFREAFVFLAAAIFSFLSLASSLVDSDSCHIDDKDCAEKELK